jgi:hypothetical protein
VRNVPTETPVIRAIAPMLYSAAASSIQGTIRCSTTPRKLFFKTSAEHVYNLAIQWYVAGSGAWNLHTI